MTETPRLPDDEPLSTRQLEIFVALLDCGSFTKAARQLGLSQPTVSGHMSDLEGRLGLRLVERSRSGTQPTDAGAALLPAARDALRGERNVRLAAAERLGLVRGALRVGASSIPAVHLLPQRLAAFRAAHPDVQLQVTSGSSGDILDAIVSGALEIGLTGAPGDSARVQSHAIEIDELVLICSADHTFANRASVPLSEVLAEPLILRREGSATRSAMMQGLGLQPGEPALRDSIQVESSEEVKAMVRAGLGVSFVSQLSANEDVANGVLGTATVEGFAAERAFHVVSGSPESLSPAARAFRDLLLNRDAPSNS